MQVTRLERLKNFFMSCGVNFDEIPDNGYERRGSKEAWTRRVEAKSPAATVNVS